MVRPILLAVGLVAGGCTYAIAGGLDDEPRDEEEAPVYFGFVRDDRGTSIAGAEVLLRPKVGLPVSIRSNAMGMYRAHIGKHVSPDDVQVSCAKPGYKQLKVLRRTPPGKGGPIQTECTLQRG